MDSILDSQAISGAYFFPRPDTVNFAIDIPVDGAVLRCIVDYKDPSRKTMIHFHGNGEVVADYLKAGGRHAFSDLGINVVYVEYRGYGRSTDHPKLAAMLSDGERVVEALGIPYSKIVAFGRSMGSLYAIELAARHPEIAGLILESGIADPAERFLTYADLSETNYTEDQVRAEVNRLFDHQAKLGRYSNPLLILHTENDGLIHISHAERNLAWAASSQKRLVRFPHGNHNSISYINRLEYDQEIEAFLSTLQLS